VPFQTAQVEKINMTIEAGKNHYSVYIGHHLWDSLLFQSEVKSKKIFIVTDEMVEKFYLKKFIDSLKDKYEINYFVLPPGESFKTVLMVEKIATRLLELNYSRDSTLVAFGGGVVGDLAGFLASIYKRGLSYVQIPTTLVAQTTAAVGGKTGVNHALLKNAMGTFYHPQCVIMDTAFLMSLDDRQFSNGLSEVIGYGLILDADFFYWLKSIIFDNTAREIQNLKKIVFHCCRLKKSIVEEDEQDNGRRAILNFGHTFGHAIESLTHYQSFLHGEAVAIGMRIALTLSQLLGWISVEEVQLVIDVLLKANLPVQLPQSITVNDLMTAIQKDKKNNENEQRFILLKSIGEAIISSRIPLELVRNAIESSYSFR